MSRPRVFLDVQATQVPVPEQRGLSRWVDGFAAALVDHEPAVIAGLGTNPTRPLPPGRLGSQMHRLPTTACTSSELRLALRNGPFAFHLASPFEDVRPIDALLPPIVAEAGLPLVATVFDLIPLTLPGFYLTDPRVRRAYERRLALLGQADLLLTISEHVRREVIERLDVPARRVVTVGAAAAPHFCPEPPGGLSAGRLEREMTRLRGPFVLAATGDDPRKNLGRLLEAWGLLGRDLRAEFQLLVTGRFDQHSAAAVQELVRSAGMPDDEVVVVDDVDDELLLACYRRAALFVFPSVEEGFGLSALEAACCDCPTITSDASAVPEVLSDPAAMFAPDDADSIAGAIDAALRSEERRTRLLGVARAAAERHTWKAVAARASEAYATLDVFSGPSRRWEPRARIAVVGPLEPAASDDAVFTELLVRELEPQCELDLLVTLGTIEGRSVDHRRFRASVLGHVLHAPAYDVIHDVTTRRPGISPSEQAREILDHALC